MPTSVRLDDRTRRLLGQLMRRKNMNQSEVIREAINTLARGEAAAGDLSPYDAVADLIGCVRGGDPNLSQDTGRKFTEMLLAEKRRREEE